MMKNITTIYHNHIAVTADRLSHRDNKRRNCHMGNTHIEILYIDKVGDFKG